MLVLAFAATALTAPAAAPVGASPPPSAELDTPQPHRSGIVLGLTLGAGIGQASGYPNNSQDIGDAQFYSSSGWLPGTSGTFLLMGAIADYLNFGFWFGTSSFRSGEGHARSTGVGLRVEAFPLVTLAPRFSGLGFFSEFGLGSGSLTEPNHPEAQGTQSIIGVGAFYEWSLGHILGGHLGVGPSVEYDAVFSEPLSESGLVASLRVVFYGGP